MANAHEKDPDDDEDFGFDWNRSAEGAAAGTGYLAAGETIASSTWALAPDASPTLLHTKTSDSTTTTCWVGPGGRAGQVLRLTNQVVTSAGRRKTRSHTITLVQK